MAARLASLCNKASTSRMMQKERAHSQALTGYDMRQNASCLGSVCRYIFHNMRGQSKKGFQIA